MQETGRSTNQLRRDLTAYTLARVGLVAIITVVLVSLRVPLLVSLLIALVSGFPLALLLFHRLHVRVNAALADRAEWRKRERAKLRAQLRGEDQASDDHASEGTDK
ncbi:MAG: DUF4229 domain-containing protein [Pseudonocardiaceae bacterium]|nr:DUF4229 domain-containing protein [Pseudonocardiaceae bacterium]